MDLEGEHEPIPDDLVRRCIKLVVRLLFAFELVVRRRYARLRGQDHYRLSGACQRCSKCCERPVLALPWLLYRVRVLRGLVLAWQWHINRFAFVEADDEIQTVAFRCAHFDPRARRCDSYASRPGRCRDYPRFLLDQAWPDLFEECGYRAVYRHADALAAALDKTALSPEQREKLKRRLHVVE